MNDETREYHVFISHAWEDKEAVARPLADALERLGLRVWYDEALLVPGDSLSSRVDQGLANARFGVVILSEAFFEKGWPKYELSGLKARQIHGEQVIIPIWHGVTLDQIIARSPQLADLLALRTGELTTEEIAEKIFYVTNQQEYSQWLIDVGERAIQGLPRAEFVGRDFDYGPGGGLRSLYHRLVNFATFGQLSRRFGNRIFLSGPHSDSELDLHSTRSFGHYNPEFIDWIARNARFLLGRPGFVELTRQVYEEWLSELAFLYYCTHEFLRMNPAVLARIRADYEGRIQSGMLSSQFYWKASWVGGSATAEETLVSTLNQWFDPNLAASALYFWIRRDIDGTRGRIFDLLFTVLKTYAPTAVINLSGSVEWVITPGKVTDRRWI